MHPHNVFTLKVSLDYTPISRTIEVADSTRLEVLYSLITFLFDWDEMHGYEFFIVAEDNCLYEIFDESLRELELQEGDVLEMVYDTQKDLWRHTIEVLSVKPMEIAFEAFQPKCIGTLYGNPGERSGGNEYVETHWEEEFAHKYVPTPDQITDSMQFFWEHLPDEAKLDYYIENDDDDDEFFFGDRPFGSPYNEVPFFLNPFVPISTSKPPKPKIEGRKVPNYAYKPRGKKPVVYFEKKVSEVYDWPVRDVNDLNYGIRVLEGWTNQAQKYLDQGNYVYANFISSKVLFTGCYYYQSYYRSYEKQQPRMKKFIRHAYNILMDTLPHDPTNWREVQLDDFKILKEDELEIARVKGGINLDDSIRKVEELIKGA